MDKLSLSTETPILITGCAGFIGFNLSHRLLKLGFKVVGIDNINDYYDVNLKNERLKILQEFKSFSFEKFDLTEREKVSKIFAENGFKVVVNLAAQAGVRYSLINPHAYIDSNIIGYFNILENCRNHNIEHFIYASSSSVYGLNKVMPFSVQNNVDHPVSMYAASKKSNELFAHSYSHLFNLPTTGLRFFTVYGPWGRPDMALFIFSRAIQMGEPLTLFNHGDMVRDFTYIDDIIDGILAVMEHPARTNPDWPGESDPSTSSSPFRVYNIGAGKPVKLKRFLELIEENLGKKAIVELAEMQPGDVRSTIADISTLTRDTGYQPKISVEEGINRFIDWFKEFYSNGRPIPTVKI